MWGLDLEDRLYYYVLTILRSFLLMKSNMVTFKKIMD